MPPSLVVTNPDRPAGRGKELVSPPVKEVAREYGIEFVQTEEISEAEEKIKEIAPDLMLVCAFGKILPKSTLEIPSRGCLNIHPSLLPKFRGPSPIQGAILAGEKETGTTLMLMDKKLDHGPIVAQQATRIEEKETYPELERKLALMGADLTMEYAPKLVKGEVSPVPQNDEEATFTKMISKEDGKVDWQEEAEMIERRVRAFTPWPGCWSLMKGKDGQEKVVKIKKASVLHENKTFPDGETGKVFLGTNDTIAVRTGKDFLVIEELQLEGGRSLPAKEFLQGHLDIIGTVLR